MKKYLYTLSLMRLAILTLSFFILTTGHSQTPPPASIETDLPEITMPSPTVAALMKFEEVPVNNYTGIPDVSIPLYSIGSMSKDINIDVSLKYHPSSIAVKEMAGYTGLGWSLFAGGSISRVVKGIPDEACYLGATKGNNKTMIGIYNNNIAGLHNNKYYEVLNLMGTTMNSTQLETVKNYMWYAFEKGILDNEHDLYQINFMGNTGRFYIKMTSSGVLEVVKLDNDTNFRIEFNYTYDNQQTVNKYNFIGFTIYDDKGYQYVFDVKEYTTETTVTTTQTFRPGEEPTTNFTYPLNYVSSYHLSKIYDNNQQLLVDFTFQNSTEEIVETTELSYAIHPQDQQSQIEYYLSSVDIVGLLPKNSTSIKTKSIVTKKIQQINVINKARIAFVLEQGRQDYRLNSTAHKLKSVIVKDWASQQVKKFDLDYEYLGPTGFQRLALQRVTEKNFLDSQEMIYECDYKLKTLGATYSSAINWSYDYWGYYKGASPSRETNPAQCMAGVLEKLTLPTGGFIKFDFESNTYSYIGDVEVMDFEVHPDYWDVSNQNYVLNSSGMPVSQALGSSSQPRIIRYTYTISPNESGGMVSIVDANNASPQYIGNEQYYLEPNVAYFVKFNWFIFNESGTLNIAIETKMHPTQTEEVLFGGGVRIKKIEFYENLSSQTPSRVKNYNYNFFGTSKSSGSLVFPKPVFEYYRTTRPYGDQYSINDFTYLISADFNNLMAVKTKGSDVGYKNVTVSDTNGAENGYTQYTYSSPIDHPEANYTIMYPFQPSINYDYKRGLLLNEKHFSKINGVTYEPVAETLYGYDWAGTEVTVRMGIRGYYETGCPMASSYDEYDAYIACLNSSCSSVWPIACNDTYFLSYVNSNETFGWAKLISKTTKNYFYDSGGQKTVQVNETFSYNTVNKKLNANTISNSLGEILETKYYYDSDVFNRNRIGVIKKIENFRNSELLETKEIHYSNNWTSNNSYLPESISVKKAANTTETRIRFIQYNSYGKPLELKQEHGSSIVYLWGYNQAYPIAKIENATYAQVTAALGTTSISEANLSAINNLRSNAGFDAAMITTYTYEPLKGLASITDPRGYTTSFTYDPFGRLEFAKDANQNILNKYEYYYRNLSQNQNYVKSITYKRPSTQTSINVNDPWDAMVAMTFLDGLGRPIQELAYKQASNNGDIITPISYDNFGRQEKEYLPYVRTSSSMSYDQNAFTAVSTFYATNNIQNTGNPAFAITGFPYSQKQFEVSPLNRVLKQAAPGEVWNITSGKEIKLDYQTNIASEVRRYKAETSWSSTLEVYQPTLVDDGFYPINQLYKTITKDENWTTGKNNTTEEFKNKQGQVILKRTYSDVTAPNGQVTPQVMHDTYYVYDVYGNLTYVIPPLVNTSGTVSTNDLNGLCYQYKYDSRNRLVEKKISGKAWEFMVYDKLDRPVYSGPALNPFDGLSEGWNVTKYDAFGRVVYSGWLLDGSIDSAKRKVLQGAKNAETTVSENRTPSNGTLDGVAIRHTNNVLPNASLKLLTVNYYDNYSFPNGTTPPTSLFGQTVASNVKGLATGSWVRGLNTSQTPVLAEQSYSLYDSKGRAIRSYTQNHLGGFTQNDLQLDFIGQVLYSNTLHSLNTSSAQVTTDEFFEYNANGRLRNHYHQINGGPMELISHNTYDNLGNLISKDVGGPDDHSNVGLQKINYRYNIRGWLTDINEINHLENDPGQFDDLFAFKINYNTVENSVNNTISPLYNGNISETFWQTQSDGAIRKYGYKYDQLNRLQKAIYQKPDEINPIRNSYNENLWYDKNGNITRLHRTGELDDVNFILNIDDLQYTYDSVHKNRLMRVYDVESNPNGFKDDVSGTVDTDDDYAYDDYGNMTRDANKEISRIYYNHLNLPIKIVLRYGIIEYLYTAAGVKVEKKVTQGSTVAITDYQNGYQYVSGQLLFFPHSEGYVNVTEGEYFNYVYNYTDHLGNIRVSFGLAPESNELKILEENHYYPFGLKHSNYNVDKN
ncbi:MAG: DUF6443 domain-containing protein, partial [Flavobacterium sp.]|nr:DUF6443 domain-containing protein [Flavobacterium sp.]